MNTKLRRHLLRPIGRRRRLATIHREISCTLRQLNERATGELLLKPARDIVLAERKTKKPNRWKDPDAVRDNINLVRVLYLARKIALPELVFYVSLWIEGLNEGRWLDGGYNPELRGVNNSLHALESEYGLKDGEYWPRGQGPAEYEKVRIPLEAQFEAALERHFIATLKEFELDDIAALWEHSPKEYDDLRERGRRSLFHRNEIAPALLDVVVHYESEASKAASSGTYSPAIALLAAGLEGLLLLRCLRAKNKAVKIAKTLPKRIRPSSLDDLTKWHFETLIEVCFNAGWLPSVSTEFAVFDPAALAHALRAMRDFLHPGRCARERPWILSGAREYEDALTIYLALESKLSGRNTRASRRGKAK